MVGCASCEDNNTFLFRCPHCGRQFCAEHQPVVSHQCSQAPPELIVEDREIRTHSPDSQHTADQEQESIMDYPFTTLSSVLRNRLTRERLVGLAIAMVVVGVAAGGYMLADSDAVSGLSDGLTGDSGASVAGTLNETVVEEHVAGMINERREERGLESLRYDDEISRIADYHSEDMATREYVDHRAPDGETVDDRFDAFGYECRNTGELILYTVVGEEVELVDGTRRFETEPELARGIVDLWLQSDPHREAIFSPVWERIGVGVVVTGDGSVYVTANTC